MERRTFSVLLLALLLAGCGWPARLASPAKRPGVLQPIAGFEGVRAVDGYANEAFQRSFDAAAREFAKTPIPADGRRDFDMLVLSSGGVNGSFGAGIMTAWTERGDRPIFRTVTGVSVGALMAPFVFAGPSFDQRLERVFRRIKPEDLHVIKGVFSSVLWDESLADNTPLYRLVDQVIDESLMRAVAARHREGRRCWIGTTNMDVGNFCIWDLGAIACYDTPAALALMRQVLLASASIPVVYPPVRFAVKGADDLVRDEMHADGAVIRPLFMPQNVFDGHLAAERAGLDWEDIDATMYVVHNGSLRPAVADVQRETLAIATRTVTMMSYTLVTEHVLHLYMLTRLWRADFRFHSLPDGLDLSMNDFGPEDTNRLYLLGRGLMQRREPWREAPPGYVVSEELGRLGVENRAASPAADEPVVTRLEAVEEQLRLLREELRAMRQN